MSSIRRVRLGALCVVLTSAVVVGCSQESPSPVPTPTESARLWEEVLADDERFTTPLDEHQMEQLCSTLSKIVRDEISTADEEYVDFPDHFTVSSCNSWVVSEIDGVEVSFEASAMFYSLDRRELDAIATVVADGHQDDSDPCPLTDQVGAMAIQDHRFPVDSPHGPYCQYTEAAPDNDESYTRGSFLAHRSLITVEAEVFGSHTDPETAAEMCKVAVETILPPLMDAVAQL